MDILAHSLWTNILYKTIPATRYNRKVTIWGIVFSLLPDFLAFTPIFIYALYASLFQSQPFLSGPPGNDNPFFSYAVVAYNFTHSLVIWLIVLLITWAIIKKFPWVLLGWGLHVFIDIFSHTDAYFATPFLFPISGFKISVISWAHPVFMVINYGLLLILYLFFIPKTTSKPSPLPPKA